MPTSSASRNDRQSAGLFRVPLAAAGAALLGLSLLLSVGPALAAANHSNGNDANGNGNGTSGNVKVHDATTGVETAGNGNEPHVCDFWLGFSSDTPEAGTWTVVSWAPTGDGSTVASGAYDTSVNGVDSSSIIELPAGHYRVEWAATGETVTSKKTFWVDAACDEAVTPADEPPVDEPPADEPAPPADESGSEEPASPVEDPAPPAGDPPIEDSAPTDDGSPAEEPAAPSDESAGEGSVLSNDGSSPEDPGAPSDESPSGDSPAEEPASQGQEPVTEDPGAPSDESPASPSDPSSEEHVTQATEPGATDSPAPPTADQLGSTVGTGKRTMSDTAAPTIPVPSGLVATFGLLLLIVAHATTRRGKLSNTRA